MYHVSVHTCIYVYVYVSYCLLPLPLFPVISSKSIAYFLLLDHIIFLEGGERVYYHRLRRVEDMADGSSDQLSKLEY